MIKFRAWDDRQKEYIKDVLIGSNGKIYFDDGVATQDDLDIRVEQFTGLKDVNGKDIYVGDIVQPVRPDTKSKIGKHLEVKKGNYVYGKWIARSIADNGYGVIDWYTGDELVVIGNVHANPELLEEKK